MAKLARRAGLLLESRQRGDFERFEELNLNLASVASSSTPCKERDPRLASSAISRPKPLLAPVMRTTCCSVGMGYENKKEYGWRK
jgi:hypothetical protein